MLQGELGPLKNGARLPLVQVRPHQAFKLQGKAQSAVGALAARVQPLRKP